MNEWSKAEHHAEKARQLFESGQWDKALGQLKKALGVNPGQTDWLFALGLTLDALERYEEAAQTFEQVTHLRPNDVLARLYWAEDLIRIDQTARAVQVLEQASRIDPQCEPAFCHRILAYACLGQHDEAEQMFYLAQQITEDCPRCFDHLAFSLASRGKLDRAIWCWQRALQIDPRYPDAHANLARCHWQCRHRDRAKQSFVLHLRRHPGDAEVLLQFGALLLEMGNLPEAREKFHRVLELDPTVALAHRQLGELSLLQGHLDSAASELDLAQRLDPNCPGIHLSLAKLSVRRKNHPLAKSHLLAQMEQPHYGAHHALEIAALLIEVNLFDKAIQILRPLTDHAEINGIQPDELASAHLCQGVALLLSGQTEAGIHHCRRGVKLAPTNTPAMINLASAYLELGRHRRARYWLRKALKAEPRNSALRRLRYKLIRSHIVAFLPRLLPFWPRSVKHRLAQR